LAQVTVFDGDPALPRKKGTALAQFFAHGWIKTPLGTVVNLNAGNVGIAAPPKTGTAPLAHVYGGQTAGWMKTPLGTEVDLSPGHIVLNGDPAPPLQKGHSSPRPLFGACLLWPRSPISATAELLFKYYISNV